MPRFKDENDFPDRELLPSGGRSFSSEAVFERETSNMLVNGPVTIGPARRLDSVAQTADEVPSPKVDDGDGEFVNIRRSDDARRQFVRSSNRWPSTLWGNHARLDLSSAWRPVFANPEEVVPCIERKTRREVLFARKRAGGAGSRRRKRRNYWSTVRC